MYNHAGGSISAQVQLDETNPRSRIWPLWAMEILGRYLPEEARERLHVINGAMCEYMWHTLHLVHRLAHDKLITNIY